MVTQVSIPVPTIAQILTEAYRQYCMATFSLPRQRDDLRGGAMGSLRKS